MYEEDRRLVIIIQGDPTTSHLYLWLESPCDEHGSHVLTKANADFPPQQSGDAWTWARESVEASLADLCVCDATEAPEDTVARILKSSHV